MPQKFATEDALLYFKQKLSQIFQPRERRTGSDSEYRVLSDNNLTDELAAKIEGAAPASSVPTKTSQLANDSGFATEEHVAEAAAKGDADTLASAKSYADGKAAEIVVPTKVSQLSNDSSFQSSSQVQQSISSAVEGAKTEIAETIDAAVSSLYKPAGSVSFASLPAPSKGLIGKVYNVTDAFATTASFVEGAGQTHPKGTNVVCVNTSGATYKWDVLAGMVDLSPYLKAADVTAVTNADIDAMF